MNRKMSVGVAVALTLLAVTITFTVTMIFSMRLFDKKVLNVKQRAVMYDKLSEIDTSVRKEFCYDIDETLLSDSIASGYVSGLNDADSQYLTSSEIAQRKEAAKGMTVSLGFDYHKESSGYIGIMKVYEDSSADSVGLVKGDVIVKIDDTDVLEAGYDECDKMLKNGVVGERLSITYSRDGVEKTVELTWMLTEMKSVLGYNIDGEVYYIRFNDFKSTTLNQFETVISEVREKKVKGLILDVRGNDGGIDLGIAADVLDEFMPAGSIVTGRYMNGEEKVLYTSDAQSLELPMVVLVDENTVGYAELFASVLSGVDNCNVVGMTTAGKGTLQQLIQLTDGSGVNVTVAMLIPTGSGVFDGVGIVPDYEVDAGEGFILNFAAAPSENDDPQYNKALELINSMLK